MTHGLRALPRLKHCTPSTTLAAEHFPERSGVGPSGRSFVVPEFFFSICLVIPKISCGLFFLVYFSSSFLSELPKIWTTKGIALELESEATSSTCRLQRDVHPWNASDVYMFTSCWTLPALNSLYLVLLASSVCARLPSAIFVCIYGGFSSFTL